MLKDYITIKDFGEDRIIIEKSTFIGYAKPVVDEDEALAFISEIKKKHRDATHNVSAYVLGDNNNIMRFSDDGEPQGTAGIPVLEVLKKIDVRNVCVVVTRYFGGIKLGAGGLVRAYTKGAVIGLKSANIVRRRLYSVVEVAIDYTLLASVQNKLRLNNYVIKDTLYSDKVSILVYVLLDCEDEFKNLLIDWCNAKVEFKINTQEYLDIEYMEHSN